MRSRWFTACVCLASLAIIAACTQEQYFAPATAPIRSDSGSDVSPPTGGDASSAGDAHLSPDPEGSSASYACGSTGLRCKLGYEVCAFSTMSDESAQCLTRGDENLGKGYFCSNDDDVLDKLKTPVLDAIGKPCDRTSIVCWDDEGDLAERLDAGGVDASADAASSPPSVGATYYRCTSQTKR